MPPSCSSSSSYMPSDDGSSVRGRPSSSLRAFRSSSLPSVSVSFYYGTDSGSCGTTTRPLRLSLSSSSYWRFLSRCSSMRSHKALTSHLITSRSRYKRSRAWILSIWVWRAVRVSTRSFCDALQCANASEENSDSVCCDYDCGWDCWPCWDCYCCCCF